ncbi:GNAT family N-acetyltransferase [Jeotgalibacillus salarius]|uniref:N-acetyltransferase n=1 Tax=Jeotgalibacillus salarius TaxID=546023 RepID=A0A4Y8LK10_9BACL|nr:GNAT family N-acetyltransferase [Jeotgalibacillus salarius]TFE01529.1 N-acetyltransferase [Jeotgalibacillus salarius]
MKVRKCESKLTLRDLSLNDVEAVLEWSRDLTFCQANGWPIERNPEELRHWWISNVNQPPENFVRLGIVLDGELIGYADLASISEQSAEIGIAIGKSGLWGNGIGAQAAVLMMKYGVEELNLTVFYAETHEANIRSRRMLEKLGFQEVSRVGLEEYEGKRSRLIQYDLHK